MIEYWWIIANVRELHSIQEGLGTSLRHHTPGGFMGTTSHAYGRTDLMSWSVMQNLRQRLI
jgi:hypothetical protein